MSATAKFLFDVDFGRGADAPAEPTITASALAEAVAEAQAHAYRNGVMSVEAQARADAERRDAVACERIAAALGDMAHGLDAVARQIEAEAVAVAFSVARKLAAELVAAAPMAEVEALFERAFAEFITAPHVVVRVHEAQYPAARERLDAIAQARGFEGRLVVLGEPDIAPGDCRIEWADGGLTRTRTQTEAAIAEVVERYVGALRGDAATPQDGGEG
ncbi:MAG: flagellar assembly protein FliH [Proteobacteria bacterium]|nr:flagellar assembly protein FliH [Pseudomonadota bacterium]